MFIRPSLAALLLSPSRPFSTICFDFAHLFISSPLPLLPYYPDYFQKRWAHRSRPNSPRHGCSFSAGVPAGKSSILYQFKLGQQVNNAFPTLDFNVESVTFFRTAEKTVVENSLSREKSSNDNSSSKQVWIWPWPHETGIARLSTLLTQAKSFAVWQIPNHGKGASRWAEEHVGQPLAEPFLPNRIDGKRQEVKGNKTIEETTRPSSNSCCGFHRTRAEFEARN